eukprot:363453-Chlamydomonas_euryale.AAC.8
MGLILPINGASGDVVCGHGAATMRCVRCVPRAEGARLRERNAVSSSVGACDSVMLSHRVWTPVTV